ncbi:SDR family NAD(P)-dependent oxidoreductase [Olivibacter domesticus]|uniref:NAD(P)-dependent dehydrogenase, short-chain alcohol dehydrogenase family n=1 Tax=Olivibacter domesticus TaxID=407022 RepID=A0A1H7UDK1_OLID1|nr:SDR family NAD(P)-dependent oxidoreductase [Olivibacter domesticus]SEL95140.1 NAD(P)-dependent dehydrogenase, short-chain alcohol dehydrogenase family [Olivibacter domesticus]
MRTALVTGANNDIGLEIARKLVDEGFFVYMGSRDLQNGIEAVKELAAEGLGTLDVVQLDVNSQLSVDAARTEIGVKIDALDVLINNAAIIGDMPKSALGYCIDSTKEVFETNYYGTIRVVHAFLDLMRKSPKPRIVNVTYGLGSVASDPANLYYPYKTTGYQCAKTALNMYTINLAYDLRETNFKVNAVDPGFIKIDFDNSQGTEAIEDAANRIVKYALIGNDGPTGKFYSECGQKHKVLRN